MSLFKGVAALLSAEVPDWVYMRSLASRRDDAVAVGRAKISPCRPAGELDVTGKYN